MKNLNAFLIIIILTFTPLYLKAYTVAGISAGSLFKTDCFRVGKISSPSAPKSKLAIEKLKVSSNGRFLVTADGKPFFPVVDTAWCMAWKLNKSDVNYYLDARKKQGFNTVTFGVFPGIGPETNVYGKHPFQIGSNGRYDPAQPIIDSSYDFWDHLDYIINKAVEKGLYVILLPAPADSIAGAWSRGVDNGHIIFNITNVYTYGHWLGNRYKNYTNIIWMLGDDHKAVYDKHDYRPVIRKLAEAIADGVNGVNNSDGKADYSTTLMSFFPRKWALNSSGWFHNDSWLDFNSIEEAPDRQITSVNYDYGLSPAKPTWVFEGGYEERRGTDYGAWQVRFQAYQTVFAGAFGYTYGHMSIWDFPSNWKTKLQSAGANEMQYLYNLMTSWSKDEYLSRIPDQSILSGKTGKMFGSEGVISTCIFATRTANGKKALVYSANGRNVSVKMNLLAAPKMKARWFNPRTGAITSIGNYKSGSGASITTFDPPGSETNGNDYVLILDKNKTEPPKPFESSTGKTHNSGFLYCGLSISCKSLSYKFGDDVYGKVLALFYDVLTSSKVINPDVWYLM